MSRITEVAWWKTTMPFAKVALQTTTLLIPVAVKEKMMQPIAITAWPKTTIFIGVAARRTTTLRNAMA
jgi:hypothetical protein